MGRADFGSAKYQSKQLKASGLQKLKYYCQLCQKQCRDANGFKNHLLSPSHLGRISNLSADGHGNSVVEEYSSTFEKEFLRLLKINHGTKRINANKFYQEYILNDKNHVHMNATKWLSLTSFIKHLGRLGKVRVEVPDEDDEFNLVIRLVDSSTELKARNKEKIRRTDEEMALKFITNQVAKGQELAAKSEAEKGAISEQVVEKPKNTESSDQKPTKVLVVLKGLSSKRKKLSAFADNSESEED